MNYLSRQGALVPAEAPCLATGDERYEWDYAMRKHKEAVRNVRGGVDQSQPQSINPSARRIQEMTREFCEDKKRVEIGRENRKLVDRLTSIANGDLAPDPRAPPPRSSLKPHAQSAPILHTVGGCAKRSSGGAPRIPAVVLEKSRSLNAPFRRKTQNCIEQDNAALVQRILAVRTTFEPKEERRHYERHRKTVRLLQRLPAEPSSARRNTQELRDNCSLPPMRAPPRLGGHDPAPSAARSLRGLPARGLDALFMPGDLRRSQSDPVGDSSQSAALTDAQRTLSPKGIEVASVLSAHCFGAGPEKPASSSTYSPVAAGEETTQRRRWTESDEQLQQQALLQGDAGAAQGMPPPSESLNETYGTDGWDENSFESRLSPQAGPSSQTDPSIATPKVDDTVGSPGDFGDKLDEIADTNMVPTSDDMGTPSAADDSLVQTQKFGLDDTAGGDGFGA